MKRNFLKICMILAALQFLTVAVLEMNAQARVGGGRSFGSRGSRSYSTPGRTYSQPSPYPGQSAPRSPYGQAPGRTYQQPGGGFLRGLAGGILGGVIGGMLFRSLGFGGVGGAGGGIGLFDILLIVGILYLIYRFVTRRRRENPIYQDSQYQRTYEAETMTPVSGYGPSTAGDTGDVDAGLAYIRQMDPNFDENRFRDQVMDMFFKIQGAWMNRDLSTAGGLLTDEMRRIIQEDVDTLIREKKINRLENIAVRDVDIVEAWQESGQDFITARMYANLLDYTTDDTTGQVISGSKTDPVKFEEYWTFTRNVGNNPWKLSAISQA